MEKNMSIEFFDFHTHPYTNLDQNICVYKDLNEPMTAEAAINDLKSIGISKFAGSVITKPTDDSSYLITANESAFYLRELYGDSYIPGIQVDPKYLEESIAAIDKTIKLGFNLIGELVPYHYHWEYSDPDFRKILDYTKGKNMVYSLHTTDLAVMQSLAEDYPETTFVFAHPGEKPVLVRHIEVMKACKNVYLDLSGTGLFRLAMLKKLIFEVGAERILFGSDYPVCNPGMYVGGIMFENISDNDRRLISADNAKRLLKI